jgi:hypothetical protein
MGHGKAIPHTLTPWDVVDGTRITYPAAASLDRASVMALPTLFVEPVTKAILSMFLPLPAKRFSGSRYLLSL